MGAAGTFATQKKTNENRDPVAALQEQLWAIRPKRRSPRRPGWNRRAAAQRTSSATSEVPVPVSPFYQLYQLYAL